MGWDKPLDIKMVWNVSGLKTALSREAGTGPLGQSLDVMVRHDNKGLTIRSPLRYAAIQDRGGTIPAFQSEGVMRFKVAGQVVFATSRGPIVIKPKHYTTRSVNSWYRTIGVVWK